MRERQSEQPAEPKSEIKGDYRLDVKDFGPIVEASVDLRPLTVFIGPSNTGKSYLAILIYVLHQCFGASSVPSYGLRWRRDWPIHLSGRDATPEASIRQSLDEWLSNAISQGDPLPALPRDVFAHIRSVLENAKDMDRHLEQETRRCYSIDGMAELVRHPGSSTAGSVDISVPQTAGAVRCRLAFGKDGTRFSGQISNMESMEVGSHDAVDHRDLLVEMWDPEDRPPEVVLGRLMRAVFRKLFQPLFRNAYYLPADRTGVMHSHQVVVNTLVQNAATAGLRPSSDIPMLSGVLADFLSQLIGISGPRRRPGQFAGEGLAGRIEKDILKGSVRVDLSETGYPVFAYRPNGWKGDLPLMRASSMVSELAPVVLYLRHVVRQGDVLIIEEPESHLHPAMQAVFALELARLARSGIRVVVTTHSEWLLDQFANLVRLSALPERERKEFVGADEALRPEDFGAWLFKPKQRPMGSVVEELNIDPDAGGLASDYYAVAEQLYNEWAGIGNRIAESKEQ